MSDNFSERGSLPTFLVVILAVVFIGVSVAAGYFLGGYFRSGNKKTDNQNTATENSQNVAPTNTDTNTQPTPTSTSSNIPVTIEGSVVKLPGLSFDLTPYRVLDGDRTTTTNIQYVSLAADIADKIQWTGFYSVGKLGFFNTEHIKINSDGSSSTCDVTNYYLGGWFEHNGQNGLVVFADANCPDDFMGGSMAPYTPFVLYSNQIVLLSNYKSISSPDPLEHIVRGQVKVDKNFKISYLDFPQKLTIKPGIVLDYTSTESASEYVGSGFDTSTAKKLDSVPIFGDVYLDASLHNFFLLGRDKRYRTYSFTSSLLDKGSDTVIYKDGKKISGYSYLALGGCGGPTLSILIPEEVNVTKDLEEVGQTVSGLKV